MRESGGHPELGLERPPAGDAGGDGAGHRPPHPAHRGRGRGGGDRPGHPAGLVPGELRQALASPYFARLDFHPGGGAGPETFYIGKTHFARRGWRSSAGRPPWPPSSTAPPGRRPPTWPPRGDAGPPAPQAAPGDRPRAADPPGGRPGHAPAALVPGVPVGAPGAPAGGPPAGLAGALSGPASPGCRTSSPPSSRSSSS